jgi:hypothetical protein
MHEPHALLRMERGEVDLEAPNVDGIAATFLRYARVLLGQAHDSRSSKGPEWHSI